MRISVCVAAVLCLMVWLGGGWDGPDQTGQQEGAISMTTAEMIQMIDQDMPNDGKGLLWDGQRMAVVDDELDQPDLLDGRGGMYGYTRLRTAVGAVYSVDSDGLLEESHQVRNDAEGFMAESERRYIRVSPDSRSYVDMLAIHTDQLAEGLVADLSFDWMKNGYCEQTMMTAPSGRLMMGVRFVVPAADDTVRVYEYGGMGLLADIVTEASMMAHRTIR